MKRFTVVASVFSISVLAVWSFLHVSTAYSSKAKFDNTPMRVYDATGEMLKAIHAGDQMAVPVTGPTPTRKSSPFRPMMPQVPCWMPSAHKLCMTE